MRIIPLFLLLCSGFPSPSIHGEDGKPLRNKQEVVYARYGVRELLLDWIRPDDRETYPGVIVVHGGGWTGGNRSSFQPIANDIARAGYVVANLEYRLATETRFPGAVLDVKAAVRWMRSHAAELGLDPKRIGGVGGSAGGHLIAMVASTADRDEFSKADNHADQSDGLQAAVIMGSGVDQVARVKESKSGSIRNCVIFFGGEYEEVPEVYIQGSPISHVASDTAPLLMLDGEFDRPRERYPEYRAKLDAAGVTNEFAMIRGAKHGQWGKPEFRPAFVAAMLKFLDQQLK